MPIKNNSPYTASLTGCGFMFTEMNLLLPLLLSEESDLLLKKEIEENNLLLIKSETSRKRAIAEFKKRVTAVPRSFWDWYNTISDDTKLWAMFYVVLKTYRILFDLQINVVLCNWRSISQTVTSNDLMSEIYNISSHDEFVDSWSEDTKRKITSSCLTILRKVGLLDDNTDHLLSPTVNEQEFAFFYQIGESWFLEACLLESYVIHRIKSNAI